MQVSEEKNLEHKKGRSIRIRIETNYELKEITENEYNKKGRSIRIRIETLPLWLQPGQPFEIKKEDPLE